MLQLVDGGDTKREYPGRHFSSPVISSTTFLCRTPVSSRASPCNGLGVRSSISERSWSGPPSASFTASKQGGEGSVSKGHVQWTRCCSSLQCRFKTAISSSLAFTAASFRRNSASNCCICASRLAEIAFKVASSAASSRMPRVFRRAVPTISGASVGTELALIGTDDVLVVAATLPSTPFLRVSLHAPIEADGQEVRMTGHSR
mmetsp:Transcript_53232/g.105769  ORF Transcript_53232/g.105769 Transcript_53232/m.105769 type:complete len:203 (+) Transcript_53232:710-1318(+)